MDVSLGKYRVESRLGGGGMAEVFRGATVGAEGFSRRVAIKRVLPGFSENPQFAKMFVAEAQISSRLQHPNIVSVLDFDRDPEQRLFLVMELVDGVDLDTLLHTGPVPVSVVIYVLVEMLRGLGYAHNLPPSDLGDPNDMRGLVHRDVSPHNVLLSWEGAVKVSDFGIAKAREASAATASVFIKGKPAYMSPEQANGSPLDGRSDLFAVGIMLWEMLSGRRLFVGGDTRETLAQVLFAPISWPRQHRPDVPADLELIAMRLLDRDINARFPSAEDVIDALLACADAPKGGRDDLIAVMAARFPQLAPARQRRGSAMRAPGDSGPTVKPYATPPASNAVGTIPFTPPAGSAISPAMGAMMSAPTRTLHRDESKPVAVAATSAIPKPSKLVIAVLVSLAVAVAGGAFVVTHRRVAATASTPPAPVAAAVVVTADAAVVAAPPDAHVAAPPDAHVAALPDAAPLPHAVVASAPAALGPAAKKFGRLKISVEPWALVNVDGANVGQTPIDIRITVGTHRVVLENDSTTPIVRTVVVTDGKTALIDLKLP